jgi:hypothetical protein
MNNVIDGEYSCEIQAQFLYLNFVTQIQNSNYGGGKGVIL